MQTIHLQLFGIGSLELLANEARARGEFTTIDEALLSVAKSMARAQRAYNEEIQGPQCVAARADVGAINSHRAGPTGDECND